MITNFREIVLRKIRMYEYRIDRFKRGVVKLEEAQHAVNELKEYLKELHPSLEKAKSET
jgi:hypothetical protein